MKPSATAPEGGRKHMELKILTVVAQIVGLCEAYRLREQTGMALCFGFDCDDLQRQAVEEQEAYQRRLNRLFETAPQGLLRPACDLLEQELRREDPDRLMGPLREVRGHLALNCPDFW